MKAIKWTIRIAIFAYCFYGTVLILSSGVDRGNYNTFEAGAMYGGFVLIAISIFALIIIIAYWMYQALRWIFTDN